MTPPTRINAVLDACVLNPAPIQYLVLPDPNDRHVLAVAIQSNSEIIVTENLKDFPKPLLSLYSITALTPDSFITSLIKQNKFLALSAFENLVKRLKIPR